MRRATGTAEAKAAAVVEMEVTGEMTGEVATGEVAVVEIFEVAIGEVATGEVATGEVATGEVATGEVAIDEVAAGEIFGVVTGGVEEIREREPARSRYRE